MKRVALLSIVASGRERIWRAVVVLRWEGSHIFSIRDEILQIEKNIRGGHVKCVI